MASGTLGSSTSIFMNVPGGRASGANFAAMREFGGGVLVGRLTRARLLLGRLGPPRGVAGRSGTARDALAGEVGKRNVGAEVLHGVG